MICAVGRASKSRDLIWYQRLRSEKYGDLYIGNTFNSVIYMASIYNTLYRAVSKAV